LLAVYQHFADSVHLKPLMHTFNHSEGASSSTIVYVNYEDHSNWSQESLSAINLTFKLAFPWESQASSESCHLMRGLLWRRALHCGVSFTFSLPHSLFNPLFPPLEQKGAGTKPVDISLMRLCLDTNIYIWEWRYIKEMAKSLTIRIERIVLYTVLITIINSYMFRNHSLSHSLIRMTNLTVPSD